MTAPPPLPPPPAGTRPSLLHAWGGVWRLTTGRMFSPGRWLAGGVLLVLLGVLSWLAMTGGGGELFYDWATSFYLLVLVPVVAFLAGAGAMREDAQSGTVDYVVTRPVPRSLYVVYRYVAQLGWAQVFGLAGLGVLLGVAVIRQVPGVLAMAPVLVATQALAILAFLALGFLCGALTSRYLVLGLTYGAVVEIGLGHIPIQLNRLSILHHLRRLLEPSAPGAEASASPAWGSTTGLLLLITALLVAAAAGWFATREFAGDQPKDG
jgi:ABC-2 type transport system permease protein